VLCQVAAGAPRGGELDANGDLTGGGRDARLREAVGEFIADDVDADEQVALALWLLNKAGVL
jgi:hypothetical protein